MARSALVVVFVFLAALLLVVWALCALNLFVTRGRADRPRSVRGMLAELPSVLLYSLFMTVNVVTFVCASGWYRLRGKPLPPAPKPWSRRER